MNGTTAAEMDKWEAYAYCEQLPSGRWSYDVTIRLNGLHLGSHGCCGFASERAAMDEAGRVAREHIRLVDPTWIDGEA